MTRRRKRVIIALTTVILAAPACGGRPEIYDVAPKAERGAARSIELPPVEPAVPVFLIRSPRPIGDRRLSRLEKMPGVAVAATVTTGRVQVGGPAGTRKLRVGAVKALHYRAVAPTATRDAEFVWSSLLSGQAVPTFDAGRRLGLSGGGVIRLRGLHELPVGAFADNGSPNIADVLVDEATGRMLDFGKPRAVAIGAATGVTVESLKRRLKGLFAGARFRRLLPQTPSPEGPSQPTPEPVAQTAGPIGTMTYRVLRNGFIRPDPSWVATNIASGTVPILGSVTCHRLMFPQLSAAMAEIRNRGLAGQIRVGDYGGCYVPRFIDRDPRKPLSMHAFGLAVDLNVSTNHLGTRGDIDPRIVQIMERWGFYWGGRFGRPDPMHFELARLIRI